MYRLFKGRTAAKAATGTLVGLALCSCAAMQSPYVVPRDLNKDQSGSTTETAQEYAADRARQLHEKLKKLDADDADNTAAAAKTNTSNIEAVVSSATRVLEIVNLDSTCAAQL